MYPSLNYEICLTNDQFFYLRNNTDIYLNTKYKKVSDLEFQRVKLLVDKSFIEKSLYYLNHDLQNEDNYFHLYLRNYLQYVVNNYNHLGEW